MAAGSRAWPALLPLVLTACWVGEPFYAAEEVRAPIAPGLYRTAGTESPSDRSRYRVSVRRDGYTSLAQLDAGETTTVGFAPLPGEAGVFVAWFQESVEKGWEPGTLPYGLLERRGREYRLSFPMCRETRALAEAAGAVFLPDPKTPLCRFADRKSLEAGLRRAAAEGPVESLRLVLAGEGEEDD
ncbi:MAG TPA: hypothetical protein VF547_12940 [Allosphingosinicella sp.]